jgi:polyisoprenyl-phosphate glycosyltransferase
MSRTWVVTPVYHDVESFLQLRERLIDILKSTDRRHATFVVVDDSAGRDPEIGSLTKARDVVVFRPPFNLGHQRAIVYALRLLASRIDDDDLVVTLDSDGEDRPEDLPRLIGSLPIGEGSQPSIALALRTKRHEPVAFKLMYLLFRVMFRSLTGTTVRTGNYAAMSGAVARRIIAHPAFDLSYSSTMLALDLPLVYTPCERGRRYSGKSKMTYGRLAMHGVRMLMPFTDRIAIRALCLFVTALALGIALALAVLCIKLFTDSAIPGWATITALGAVIVSLVALGNLITLFVLFSQTRAVSLSSIEELNDGRA